MDILASVLIDIHASRRRIHPRDVTDCTHFRRCSLALTPFALQISIIRAAELFISKNDLKKREISMGRAEAHGQTAILVGNIMPALISS